MSNKRKVFCASTVLTFATAVALAQAPPAQTTPPSAGQEQPPTFRLAVDLVTTDAIVRDASGQFISNLIKDDFEVYEDGVKQDLVSFVLVHGGRALNLQAPPAPPPQEGIILPPPRPPIDTAGRIFVIFVDDLHLAFNNTGRLRDLFKKVANTLVHEGDMFGVVSTGPSSLAIDMTYDRKRLDEAVKKVTGNGLKPSDIINGIESVEGPSELRYRAHVAFSTAYDLVKNLEGVQNRRKALIYISDGYDFNPFEEARFGTNPFFDGGRAVPKREGDRARDDELRRHQGFGDADLAAELSELTRAANRANATIYTIDPRGLVAGGADLDEQIDPTEWQKYVSKTQDSLRVLADETGGFAVVNSNNFDKALKRIDAETSDYYVLGYYSSNPDPTKRVRKIEVKIAREGLSVWSRKAYSVKDRPPVASSSR